ncbi:MAG: hypothetical protein ACQETH_14890 [Candidatus Rifleibacteriota bacterium]
MRFKHRFLLLATGVLLFCTQTILAQVSLLPQNRLTIENTTLLRDSKNKNHWYYVPQKPLLVEREPSNAENPRPVFKLFCYQSEENNELYEGAMLQFSVSLQLTEEKRRLILKELKKQSNDEIVLKPLPFRLGKATLYDQNGGKLIHTPQAPGLAPPYILGELPFQMQLNKFDANLYSALVDKKNSGVGVLLQLEFEGLLPPAGFKVTMNWDQTYEYLKKSDDMRFKLGCFLVGAEVGINKTKIREELIQNKCIEVETMTGEKVSNEDLDQYLDPVLARISKEMFQKIQPPEEIKETEADNPDLIEKCFFPLKMSFKTELKDIKITKKGSETITFNKSVITDRITACGTFIGINKYNEATKNTLVNSMPLNNWAKAFLVLPSLSERPEVNINSVTMTANVIDSSGNQVSNLSDTATWSSGDWHDKNGNITSNLSFPLNYLFDKHNDDLGKIRQEYSFKVDVKVLQSIQRPPHEINTSYVTPLFNGDLPLAQPVDLVDNIVFDLSCLTFDKDNLRKVSITLYNENEDKEMIYIYNQRTATTDTIVFITAKDEEHSPESAFKARVLFDTRKERDIAWENNEKPLKEIDKSLYFMLFDNDWQK